MALYLLYAPEHHREGFGFAFLYFSQCCCRGHVEGICHQIITAYTLEGDDAAAFQHFCRVIQYLAVPV